MPLVGVTQHASCGIELWDDAQVPQGDKAMASGHPYEGVVKSMSDTKEMLRDTQSLMKAKCEIKELNLTS